MHTITNPILSLILLLSLCSSRAYAESTAIVRSIWAGPGVAKDEKSDATVSLIDIYPTVADLAGLTSPEHLQGVSLRPLLGRPERPGKKKCAYSVVSRGERLGYALRNQNWRYGKWPDGEELYNLTNDPAEKNNLAGNPDVAERLRKRRELLADRLRDAAARR